MRRLVPHLLATLAGGLLCATSADAVCLRIICADEPCGVQVRFADGAREVFKTAAHRAICLCDVGARDHYCALKDDRPDHDCEPAPIPLSGDCGAARVVKRHVGVKWDQAF